MIFLCHIFEKRNRNKIKEELKKELTLIWTILVVEMKRWLLCTEIDEINCVDFFSTLLPVRQTNMDNGSISCFNFFYTQYVRAAIVGLGGVLLLCRYEIVFSSSFWYFLLVFVAVFFGVSLFFLVFVDIRFSMYVRVNEYEHDCFACNCIHSNTEYVNTYIVSIGVGVVVRCWQFGLLLRCSCLYLLDVVFSRCRPVLSIGGNKTILMLGYDKNSELRKNKYGLRDKYDLFGRKHCVGKLFLKQMTFTYMRRLLTHVMQQEDCFMFLTRRASRNNKINICLRLFGFIVCFLFYCVHNFSLWITLEELIME